VLSWRQLDSYQLGLQLYPRVTNILLPDAAFMIGPLEESSAWSLPREKLDLLLLLRNDGESVTNSQTGNRSPAKVRELLDRGNVTRGLSFQIVDWWDRPHFFNKDAPTDGLNFQFKVRDEGKFDYSAVLRSSIAMFAGGKVLITDRLHSSILAFLLHKPHVYIDQMYGKIGRTRAVALNVSQHCQDRKQMRFAEATTFLEALELAKQMIDDYNL